MCARDVVLSELFKFMEILYLLPAKCSQEKWVPSQSLDLIKIDVG